jgi:hypothetical protein
VKSASSESDDRDLPAAGKSPVRWDEEAVLVENVRLPTMILHGRGASPPLPRPQTTPLPPASKLLDMAEMGMRGC